MQCTTHSEHSVFGVLKRLNHHYHPQHPYSNMAHIEKATLLSGAKIPLLGLGTWGSSSTDEVHRGVKEALRLGYRHIDCARVYSHCEEAVGPEIKAWITQGGKREDLFVTTKARLLSSTLVEARRASLDESLRQLQLDYVDLLLIHWPMVAGEASADEASGSAGVAGLEVSLKSVKATKATDEDMLQAWKHFKEFVAEGRVRNIGISNVNRPMLEHYVNDLKIVPDVIQIEAHPYLPQEHLVQYCKTKGIHVTVYAPLGSPSSPFTPSGAPRLLDNPVIAKVAKNHDTTPSAVLLSWGYQRGCSVIPKSTNPGRLADNLKLIRLSDDEMSSILALGVHNYRYFDPRGIFGFDLGL